MAIIATVTEPYTAQWCNRNIKNGDIYIIKISHAPGYLLEEVRWPEADRLFGEYKWYIYM